METPSRDEMLRQASEVLTHHDDYPMLVPWADALLVERDAREAAERERDRWKAAALADTDHFEARVAALEEALREYDEAVWTWDAYPSVETWQRVRDARDTARAVLGVQSTPTETGGKG